MLTNPSGFLACCLLVLIAAFEVKAQSPDSPQPSSNEVTAEDVKEFLDPTRMNNLGSYSFEFSALPGGIELVSNKLEIAASLNHWSAVWASVPLSRFLSPSESTVWRVGDLELGWGMIIHENLKSRWTAAAGIFEVQAPTGNPVKGTGVGTYVLAPGGAFVVNPTDHFPIYVSGRYRHSVGAITLPGESGPSGDRVRAIDLTVNTVHILPKGVFLAAIPSFLFDIHEDFRVFSLGVGAGRAVTKNLVFEAGYVYRAAGRTTFTHGFSAGLRFIWGKEKVKKEK